MGHAAGLWVLGSWQHSTIGHANFERKDMTPARLFTDNEVEDQLPKCHPIDLKKLSEQASALSRSQITWRCKLSEKISLADENIRHEKESQKIDMEWVRLILKSKLRPPAARVETLNFGLKRLSTLWMFAIERPRFTNHSHVPTPAEDFACVTILWLDAVFRRHEALWGRGGPTPISTSGGTAAGFGPVCSPWVVG